MGGGAGVSAGGSAGSAGKKIIFNSYGIYPGYMTQESGIPDPLEAADAYCAENGDDIAPGKTWRAYISTSQQDAISRVTIEAEWYLPDGTTRVFANKAAWAIGPENPIDVDQTGESQLQLPWTGSTADGTKDIGVMCKDWGSGSPLGSSDEGRVGTPSATDGTWLASYTDYCSTTHSLYCFEL